MGLADCKVMWNCTYWSLIVKLTCLLIYLFLLHLSNTKCDFCFCHYSIMLCTVRANWKLGTTSDNWLDGKQQPSSLPCFLFTRLNKLVVNFLIKSMPISLIRRWMSVCECYCIGYRVRVHVHVVVSLCSVCVTYWLPQSMEVQAEPQEIRGKKKGKGTAKSGPGKVHHRNSYHISSSCVSGQCKERPPVHTRVNLCHWAVWKRTN